MMNREGDELVFSIIRGEAGEERRPSDGEHDYRREDRRVQDDVVDEDEISSFLNASGEGDLDLMLDEGQTTNNDDDEWIRDDDPSTTTDEVYILISLL